MKTVCTIAASCVFLTISITGCLDSSKKAVSSSGVGNGAKPSSIDQTDNPKATSPDDGLMPQQNGEEESQPITLRIGNPAPALKLATWVKGQPVKSFEAGQVYVVEFWATWCPPCRQSMPHLSTLQRKYGERVRMIGVSDEDEPTVRGFLKQDQQPGKTWDQVVQYSLALDDAEATNRSWLRAAGQSGIPTAFVVGKDGVVEWIGHPMEMDEPLEKIVAGDWDRAAAVAEVERAAARKLAIRQASVELRKAQEAGDTDEAIRILDELVNQGIPSEQLALSKINLLRKAGRTDEATKLVNQLVEDNQDNVQLLNGVAWGIAAEGIPGGLDLALKAARRASELKEDKEASVLDTLARVYFEQGNLDEAIAWQKKAVALAPDEDSLAKSLQRYEDAKAKADQK